MIPLTREQVMVSPNWQIRNWVCQYVMKWEYRPRFDGDTTGYWGEYISEDVPEFPNDIAAAWEVVEKMGGDGYKFTIGEDRDCRKPWDCIFIKYGHDNPNTYGQATADTASLAICKAALLAVMESEE